jgi:hypothetical protein
MAAGRSYSLSLLAILTTITVSTAIVAGCGARDSGIFGPGKGNGGEGAGVGGSGTGGDEGGGPPLPPASADKVDLLLVIDNSRSMSDKQEILSLTVPELMNRLINPVCVDEDGVAVAGQPATPDDDCPAGSERLFPAVTDIHIGVISTSIGGHGSDACVGDNDPSENDQAHLLDRGPGGGSVATYEGKQFLAWDPLGEKDPPGLASTSSLETNLKALIVGTGQVGCGFESQMESWYRFLVEPEPHESIVVQDSQAVLQGLDNVILDQRRNFLRPDSLLSIVVLSDENDCSIRDGGQFFFAAQIFTPNTTNLYHLPQPRAACEDDPFGACCRSCGQAPADGCDTSLDPCTTGPLSDLEDNINLRCFNQKRRFGIDFLWPIDRYRSGLNDASVADRFGNVVPNPIFSDLDPTDDLDQVRDSRLVFLTSLVGVPWQDLARQSDGSPDLLGGLDDEGRPIGGFQYGEELEKNGTWDLILGEPMTYVSNPSSLPKDPLMRESVEPRSGQHPITNEAVAPPGAGTNANTINGHEYSIPSRNDLQYSCVFQLFGPRDCSNPSEIGCDCVNPNNDNPLCQNEFNQFGTTQYRAKAYPGIRHLELAREIGSQAVVGSICPAQLNNANAADFGYIPTVRTLLNAAAPVLQNGG